MSIEYRNAIHNHLKQAGGKWVNLDEIVELVRLNRKDVNNIMNAAIKNGTWKDIQRKSKRGKNLTTTLIGRPVYIIKYRWVEEC